MANAEHINILKDGVPTWNLWRERNREVSHELSRADLSGADGAHLAGADFADADLNGADLTDADLRNADLNGAVLSGAVLIGADMKDAQLRYADLSHANLIDANLSEADLTGADLSATSLSGANLTAANLAEADVSYADLSNANLSLVDLNHANLTGADLSRANLSDANLLYAKLNDLGWAKVRLSGAKLGWTSLTDSDLSGFEGLGNIYHAGPSSVGLDTFFKSNGKIPAAFLRGVGVPDIFLQHASSLTAKPLEFYSCFISYDPADKLFAGRLHDALLGRGIRCWLDEKQPLPGNPTHQKGRQRPRLEDKVLLCCSKSSLNSWWVDEALQMRMTKEKQFLKARGKAIVAILPLNVDAHLFDLQWEDWKKQYLTSRLTADFTGRKKGNGKFETQLELVIKALRKDAREGEGSATS